MVKTYKIKNKIDKALNQKLFNSSLILKVSQLSFETSAKIVEVTATNCSGEGSKREGFQNGVKWICKGQVAGSCYRRWFRKTLTVRL